LVFLCAFNDDAFCGGLKPGVRTEKSVRGNTCTESMS
jgi:hypothetical protein